MHAPAHSGYHALASPLAIAGYVAIAAVWYTAIDALAAIDPALAVPARVAVAAFAAGYLATFLPLPGSPYERLCVVVLGVATLGLLWLGPTGTSGVLLVLFAAVLASTVHGTGLVSTLLAVNAVFLGIMRWRWGADWDEAFSMLAAWGSFQMFATLLTHATTRAEAMSEALRASNADLLATRELLAASARDAERLHIARELHDVAGHKLTALKLNLAAQERASGRNDAGGADLCARLVDELLGDIRGVVARMRQDDGLDLRAALSAMAGPFPRPRIHLQIDDDARASTLAQAEALLRTAQEALTNAARHSQARNLWLVLRRDGGQLQLDIRDDGRAAGELRPGHGLSGMRERLEQAGGGLALERTGTGGVHLRAWLPAAP